MFVLKKSFDIFDKMISVYTRSIKFVLFIRGSTFQRKYISIMFTFFFFGGGGGQGNSYSVGRVKVCIGVSLHHLLSVI